MRTLAERCIRGPPWRQNEVRGFVALGQREPAEVMLGYGKGADTDTEYGKGPFKGPIGGGVQI